MARPRKRKPDTTDQVLFSETGPDPLDLFLPVVGDWFRASVGTPTDAQAKGWPSIQSSQNTLIVAPTGSGKTLAAFLAGLDALWRQPKLSDGVQILYISPLKALNQDIHRNLELPLMGVSHLAESVGTTLPKIRTGVRTGDTSQNERQAQARKPPHVLITTPESLHLILASRARAMLTGVQSIIIDELHAVAGQKRGTFLAILLERLVQELGRDPVRIGLTATVNPIEEAGRFLAGFTPDPKDPSKLDPRPVNIVRAIGQKQWDLLVKRAEVDPDPNMPRTIWPSLESELAALIREHRSTLIFANNRYLVERLAANLNDYPVHNEIAEVSAELQEFVAPAGDNKEQESGEPIGANKENEISYSNNSDNKVLIIDTVNNNLITDSDNKDLSENMPPDQNSSDERTSSAFVHSHHGSISLDRRRQTEQALKDGRLRAVVCTASLELGIDMGAVELVCQIGSPGEVARGLQRVGRAGHGVGQISKGRIFAKTNADLLESAALVDAMSRSAVEPLAIPQNCLDMLAQQIIACVAISPWKPRVLLQLFRRSYPYRNLTEQAFEAVLEMVTGRYRVEAIRDLKARIYWDRVRDELVALPGTTSLALMGGGAITDTGQYPVKLGEKGPTLGTLDEEFVLERQAGEAFRLGSSTWRIDRIDDDRVVVSPTHSGDVIVVPFWRGEESRRSATLGASIGALVRRIATAESRDIAVRHLQNVCHLDEDSATDLVRFIHRQKRTVQAVPDDQTIIVEAFRDPAGEVALTILSPWGGRLHQALKLILQNLLLERLGFRPAAQHADDGLIMRLPRDPENKPPLNLLDNLNFDEAFDRLRNELSNSALFGLRFRQNAARALLLPKPDPGKRTPLWLQRLRAKDLLQVVRQMPDFPIVLECYRECLSQDLDLDLLKTILERIQSGEITVVKYTGESASPFAADLMHRFERKYLYEWDEPHKQSGSREHGQRPELPHGTVLDDLLDPRVFERLELQRIQAWARPAKSAEEFAERFLRLGDLAESEITVENRQWIDALQQRAILTRIFHSQPIWITTEELHLYEIAFPEAISNQPDDNFTNDRQQALNRILERFVSTHSLIGLRDITSRYPLETAVAADWLQRRTESGSFVLIHHNTGTGLNDNARWAESKQMQRMLGMSLAQRRRDVRAIAPDCWSAWVLNKGWPQNALQIQSRLEQLSGVLFNLQGWAATLPQWHEEIIGRRIPGFQLTDLDRLLAAGEWSWRIAHDHDAESIPNQPKITFWHQAFPQKSAESHQDAIPSTDAVAILELLQKTGPLTSSEISTRLHIPIQETRQALQECLMRTSVTNERIAFYDHWCRFTQESSRQVDSRPVSPVPARRFNQFRQMLSQQGIPNGGSGQNQDRAEKALLTVGAEGRWHLMAIAESAGDDDFYAGWAALLIARYGVISREIVKFASTSLDWSDFSDWLEAAEWRDELRRGYFVEGLSGLQYTDAETAAEFDQFSVTYLNREPLEFQLISAVDPLNLYGSTAPLDLPLLENGRARLPRIPGNFLLMFQGTPAWIIQERGRKISSLPHVEKSSLKLALHFLIQNYSTHTTKWTVATIDDDYAAKSAWSSDFADLGFFRDGLSLTRYRGLI